MSIGNTSGGSEVQNLLVQGFKAAKENRRDEAYNIFCDVVRRDPNNELGWLYRAATTDDLSEAYVCLQRVLSINPNNEKAQRGIERIQSRLNTDEGETGATPAAQPGDSGPAQVGEAEIVSGLRPPTGQPAPPPPPPPSFSGMSGQESQNNYTGYPGAYANDNQFTGRFSYDNDNTVGAVDDNPPPYQPQFDDRPSFDNRSSFDNRPPSFQPGLNLAGDDEQPDANGFYTVSAADMVEEPTSTRQRTRERLRTGRPKEANPRIGEAGNNPATRPGLLGGLGSRLNTGRSNRPAAFGAGAANTDLDQVGKARSQVNQRSLLILGALLVLLLIIVVGVFVLRGNGNNSGNPVAGTSTDTPAVTSDTGTPGSDEGTATPIVATPGGALTVPVVGTTDASGGNSTPAGQATTVPAGQPTTAPVQPTTQAPAPTQAPPPGALPRPVVYTVRGGDNLTRIAAQFSTTIAAIRAANPTINAAGAVFVGNRLVIPVSRGDYKGKGGVILAQNQTLQTIADRYKVNLDDLARFNGLAAPGDAKVGDAILIP